MKRFLVAELKKWKNKSDRKPLLLQGARQVGKTWLVTEFGKTEFENYIYINFDREKDLHNIFRTSFDPGFIIKSISAYTETSISPDTLIIFDEIQEEPLALASLKYFSEEASEYPIIATGSFMGIALHQGTSFPVGKVDTLKLYPMNYREFLCATGHEDLNTLLIEKDVRQITVLKSKYIELLKSYYFVGGMPEIVQTYIQDNDYLEVRKKQEQLLDYYRMDFSKHAAPQLTARLNQVWDSIPGQLAKENKKFIFGKISKGARSKDFELALQWLSDCGLIHIVNRVSKAGLPLKAYMEFGAFKVYLNDVGLFGAMGRIPVSAIITGNDFFEEFKGALTEEYVLMQMLSDLSLEPFYYSADNSQGEIDFLIQSDTSIIPVEVKAEENLQAKSLKAFVKKHPDRKGIRLSLSDYREETSLTNVPLYAFMTLME